MALFGRGRVDDPPEPWEGPIPTALADRFRRDSMLDHPYHPRDVDDAPAGSLAALSAAAGHIRLPQVVVLPETVRSIAGDGRKVRVPDQALAAGTQGVALWAAGPPQPGVRVVIRHEELEAVEDIHILLYGRLSLFGGGKRLTVRYNTVGRGRLQELLAVLREQVPRQPLPVPETAGQVAELPFKWSLLLSERSLPLFEAEPLAWMYGTRRGRRKRQFAAAAVLTPSELVVASDPQQTLGEIPYGTDKRHVLRSRLAAVEYQPPVLSLVTGSGTRLDTKVAPELASWLRQHWSSRPDHRLTL